MNFSWNRWRLALIAALTALVMSVAFSGQAFASEPGESSSWSNENVNGNLGAHGSLAQARNNGHLLDVWRGETNNIVWMSLDNGTPFTLPNPDGSNPQTYVSPAVAAWGPDSFMIIHTGEDGHIYQRWIDTSTWAVSSSWVPVLYQTTNLPVSVTQTGPGSWGLYMAYRGAGNDQRVFGTFGTGTDSWSGPRVISGGSSPSAPSVTWGVQGLYAAVRGEDNQIWTTRSSDYGSTWYGWQPQGGYTDISPSISANPTTANVLISAVNPSTNNYHPYYRTFDEWLGPLESGWSSDVTNWQTVNTVTLVAVGVAFYALLTGLNGDVYYKVARQY